MNTLVTPLAEVYAETEKIIEELATADAQELNGCGQKLTELSMRIEHIADGLRKLLAHVHNAGHACATAGDIIEQADWNSEADSGVDAPTDDFREYVHIYVAKAADETEAAIQGTRVWSE